MKWYEKIFNYLNGNKTTIGLVLGYLLMQQWFIDAVGQNVADVIQWVAVTFLGVGVGHKIAKSNTEPGPNA